MKYNNIISGRFITRPNRFVAKVIIDGKEETVHVKNTGRCKELLTADAKVYLEKAENPKRSTKYDLIAVEKKRNNLPPLLINMDSLAPNKVVYEFLKNGNLFSKNAIIKSEVTYLSSRFDFYVEDGERKIFIEVKGVTLEENGVAMFPDAPTLRGIKHITELEKAVANGFEAYIIFVIQMKEMKKFTPNYKTHPGFGKALKKAKENGVNILAFDSIVTKNSLSICKEIKIEL